MQPNADLTKQKLSLDQIEFINWINNNILCHFIHVSVLRAFSCVWYTFTNRRNCMSLNPKWTIDIL